MIIPFEYNQETRTFSWFGRKKKKEPTKSAQQLEDEKLVKEVVDKALSDPRYEKYADEVRKLNNGSVFFDVEEDWYDTLIEAMEWVRGGHPEFRKQLNYIPLGSDEYEQDTLLMHIDSGNLYHVKNYHEWDMNYIRVTSIKNWINSLEPPHDLDED